ncbi:MAG: prolyl oligopeptidase family serine peptidase, partial [Pseudomonadota bacterium]
MPPRNPMERIVERFAMPTLSHQAPTPALRSGISALVALCVATAGGPVGQAVAAPKTATDTAQNNEANVTAPADKEDPFLWLEDVEGERALTWVRAQNDRTLAELKNDPRFAPMEAAALNILNDDNRIAAPSIVGERVRNFWQDETHVRGIWREASLQSYVDGEPDWKTLLDLDKLAKDEDENWVWEGADCLAPDYDRCLLTLSRGGSDAAVTREFILSSGTFVEDGFNLPEMKAGAAWLGEDMVIVGGDIADDGLTASGYPKKTRVWTRGQQVEDAPVLFTGDESDVGVWPGSVARANKYFSFITRSLTFYDREYYVVSQDGSKIVQVPVPPKTTLAGYLHGTMVMTLQEDWTPADQPGETFKSGDIVGVSIIGVDGAAGTPTAKLYVKTIFSPTPQQSVQAVRTAQQGIFVQLLDNIVGSVKRFDYGLAPTADENQLEVKWTQSDVALPGQGDVSLGSVDDQGSDFFLYFDSPTEPSTLYYVNTARERVRVKQSPSFFDAEGVTMRQFEATSADGTKVPYFVIGREAIMEKGNAPIVQYGYGGFEIPITPGYAALTGKLWYENDGLYVIANIRGGGEFGPRWHQAALKENRQRAYDDFFAVSEDLIAKGLTSPEKLGALGGSNGGLLMGVAMTQRPDLYNALGIGVPLLDMLRYHTLLAGASWVGEYGNPDIPAERAYIEKYSPYQNLKADGDYPRVYFFTSTKDDRVHPGHARKMAAKMEQFDQPFLYFENIEGGHGAAANLKQVATRQALQYVYFLRQLADIPDGSTATGGTDT